MCILCLVWLYRFCHALDEMFVCLVSCPDIVIGMPQAMAFLILFQNLNALLTLE